MKTSDKLRAASPILFVAAIACSSVESEPTWTGTVTDSAGIEIVQNPLEGMWAEGEAWAVEEVLSIGEMLGDEEYQFGQIISVDVDTDGNVYIADVQASHVRVFDPTGRYTHTIGSPGAGPGEIGVGLSGVFALPNAVMVPDLGNRRVNQYGYDGSEQGSSIIDITAGIPVRWDRIGDEMVAQLRALVTDESAGPTGDVIVKIHADETRDTIGSLPVGQSLQIVNGQQRLRLFEPEPIWDASSDGRIIMAVNEALRIEVSDADGNLERIVTRPTEAKEVTDRDKRVFLNAMREAIAQQGAPAAAIDAYLQTITFAENFPAFVTISHGPNGSIWVQRILSGSDLGGEGDFNPQDLGSNTWDIFDDQGRYLGDVTFPGKYQPIKVIDDKIYGIARDEFDVQSMKVYRVVMP